MTAHLDLTAAEISIAPYTDGSGYEITVSLHDGEVIVTQHETAIVASFERWKLIGEAIGKLQHLRNEVTK